MKAYALSACVEWLFAEVADSIADRMRASAAAGIDAVEFWGWQTKDLGAIAAARRSTGVAITSFIAEPRAQLADPASHTQFLIGIDTSSRIANELGAPHLVVMVGNSVDGVPVSVQLRHVARALTAAADIAAERGIRLLIEPLNSRVDHPGRLIDRTSLALEVLTEVGSPNVRLLYDIYHSVTMNESPSALLPELAPYIGHVQIADVPGRHQPGSGTIDWHKELRALSAVGYGGRLGLEYRPLGDTDSSLAYIRQTLDEIQSAD